MSDHHIGPAETISDLMAYDGLKIIESKNHFRMSIEAVMLANFVKLLPRTKYIMDFGTGTGSIPLMLSLWTKAKMVGVEIQPELCDLARRSIEYNNLENQIAIDMDDISAVHLHYPPSSFDIVVCNPPFFPGGQPSENNMNKETAKHEKAVDLMLIATAASRLLKEGGAFCFIHRADQLEKVVSVVMAEGFALKRMRFVYPKPGEKALWMLCEAKFRGHSGSLEFMEPLYVQQENGEYSSEVSRYFHRSREV